MRKSISVLKKLKPVFKRSKRGVKWARPLKGYNVPILGGVAFSSSAHRLLVLNPNLSNNVFSAFLKIKESKGLFAKSGKVLIENLPYVEGMVGNSFFKIHVGKRRFFLKVLESKKPKEVLSPTHDLALSQYYSLIEAKRLLAESNMKNYFDVVNPQFAFVSGKYSFLVTDFLNLQTVGDILKGKDFALAKEVHDALPVFRAGTGFLERRGFNDLGTHNTFYSPKSKKFVFFDFRYHFT